MNIVLLTIALLASFYLMAKVCDDYFVDSLDKIAKRLKMSSDAAGATLMAVGSSAPELFIAIIALIKPGGHESIGLGTIVGSALFNILVITGASAIARKAVLAWQPVLRDTFFYSLAVGLLVLTFLYNGGSDAPRISIYESSFFVLLYIIYVIAVIKWRKILPYKDPSEGIVIEEEEEEEKEANGILGKIQKISDSILGKFFPSAEHYYSVFLISILFIAMLSWLMVESAIEISVILDIPEAIIALTVLAAGTSVPDLISSVVVAKQGRGGMAISNAFGSNIFDVLIGLGLPWLITIIVTGNAIAVQTTSLVTSSLILFGSIFIVFGLFVIKKWEVSKGAGYFLILLYVAYVLWEVIRL